MNKYERKKERRRQKERWVFSQLVRQIEGEKRKGGEVKDYCYCLNVFIRLFLSFLANVIQFNSIQQNTYLKKKKKNWNFSSHRRAVFIIKDPLSSFFLLPTSSLFSKNEHKHEHVFSSLLLTFLIIISCLISFEIASLLTR